MQHVPQQIERRNSAGTNGVNGNHSPPAQLILPMPAAPASEAEGGVDMPGIWNAFRRRWFLALSLGFLFGIPAAIAAWSLAPAPYVSFVELQLNSSKQHTFPFSGSRDNRVPSFQIGMQTVLKRARHPNLLTKAWEKPEVRSATMVREHEPHVLPWLEQNLSIKAGGEYFRIGLEGEQPKELAAILNGIAEVLVENINDDMHLERTVRRRQVEKLLSESTGVIDANKNQLKTIQGAKETSPAEAGLEKAFLQRLQDTLTKGLLEIEVAKIQLELQPPKLGNGQGSKSDVDAVIDQIIDRDPRRLRAGQEISDQERRIENQERYLKHLTETLAPTHPTLVAEQSRRDPLKEQLEELKQNEQTLRNEIKAEIKASMPLETQNALDPEERLKHHEAVLKAKFEDTETKLKAELEVVKGRNEELKLYSIRAAEITEVINKHKERQERLQVELERLQFELDYTPKRLEVSREAVVPHARSLKKKTMLSGAAGFGVFGFFVAGIVFLEYRTRRIASLNQVSETLNLRVMGTVPLLPRSAANGSTVKKKAKNALWYSALTEAIDSTRTLLIRGSQMESLKTVMVASAMTGEGKTTLASHLATSLARGGRKILLVDCDLRRPCMHRAFDLPAGQGVCEVLRGEADLPDCIQELDSPPGLSVLPAGKINQQVLKLLAMDSLGEMLEPLKQEYDFIILDSSPLLPVTDGLLVAQHADGVILSIRRDISRVGKVVMACQKLSMLGIPLLGAVTIGLQEESQYAKTTYKHYAYGQHYYNQPPL